MSTHSGSTADIKAIALRTINPQDCHAFVVQLADYAIDCDRLSDDEWIAEIAALRMSHDALEWYTNQDVETQESWKKLRRALLKEAKLRADGSSLGTSLTAAPPPASVPTPAAVPGNTEHRSQYSGYLSSVLGDYGQIQVTTEACDALTVWYNPIADFPILNITNPDQVNTALGVQWPRDTNESDISNQYGELVITDLAPRKTLSWMSAHCDTAAFLLLPNSSLLIISGASSNKYLLNTYMTKDSNELRIYVSYNDFIIRSSIRGCEYKLDLKIEPF